MKICQECNSKNKNKNKFCKDCGKKLKEIEEKPLVTPFRFLFTFFLIIILLITGLYIYDLNKDKDEYYKNWQETKKNLETLQINYDNKVIESQSNYNLWKETLNKLNYKINELKECETELRYEKNKPIQIFKCDYSNYVKEDEYSKLYNTCQEITNSCQEKLSQEDFKNTLITTGIRIAACSLLGICI